VKASSATVDADDDSHGLYMWAEGETGDWPSYHFTSRISFLGPVGFCWRPPHAVPQVMGEGRSISFLLPLFTLASCFFLSDFIWWRHPSFPSLFDLSISSALLSVGGGSIAATQILINIIDLVSLDPRRGYKIIGV